MAFFTTSEKFFSLHLPSCYLWLLPFVLLSHNCEIWFPHNSLWVPEVVMRCPLNLLSSRPDKQLPQCLSHVSVSPQYKQPLVALSTVGQSFFGTAKPETEHGFSEAASQVQRRGNKPCPRPPGCTQPQEAPSVAVPRCWKGAQPSQVCPSLSTCAVTVSLMAP